MESKIYHLNKDIKDTLIQTFSFDHNLENSELLDIEENAIYYKDVNHIYFKDQINIDNITKVKSMLEASTLIDDAKIDKYILINYNKEELNRLLDINYLNPDTWKVYYLRCDGIKDIYSVVECRKLREHFSNFLKEYNLDKFSNLEKICLIYDKVKLLDYKDTKNTLLEILEDKYSNSYGYNLLFQEFLEKLGIKSYIEKIKMQDEYRYISVVKIDDEKYNIHGIYLFDPFMDSLPIDDYDEVLRRINYNYFGLTLNSFNNTIYEESISGILKIFSNTKEDMFKDHLEELNLFSEEERNKFNNVFGNNYLEIYETIKKSEIIDINTIFQIIESTLKKAKFLTIDNMEVLELIKKNYMLKYKDMFM